MKKWSITDKLDSSYEEIVEFEDICCVVMYIWCGDEHCIPDLHISSVIENNNNIVTKNKAKLYSYSYRSNDFVKHKANNNRKGQYMIERIKPTTIEEYLIEKGWEYEENVGLLEFPQTKYKHMYQKNGISIFSQEKCIWYIDYSLKHGFKVAGNLSELKTELKEIKAQRKADISEMETTEFDFYQYMIDAGAEDISSKFCSLKLYEAKLIAQQHFENMIKQFLVEEESDDK